MRRFATLLFAAAACLAGGLSAQEITGTIEGAVLDPSGSAVTKAKITISSVERNQVVRTVTTDASGTYSAPFLAVGMYSVKAEAAGFKAEVRTGVALNVNDSLKINPP